MKNAACKIVLVSLVTVLAAYAEGQSRITVNVPFNFVIAEKGFPAGQYSVWSDRDKLTVQNSAGKLVFIGFDYPISGHHATPIGQVVFHCYGSRCFLSELWTPVRQTGNQLLPSRYEREVATHQQRTEFALLEEKR